MSSEVNGDYTYISKGTTCEYCVTEKQAGTQNEPAIERMLNSDLRLPQDMLFM